VSTVRQANPWLVALGGGVVAGLILLTVGLAFNEIEARIPTIGAEYHDSPVFRPWPGWSRTYMILHPVWFGFVFALVFALLGRGRNVGTWQREALRGALYGVAVFAVGSLPVFVLIYASFRVSATLVGVSWALRNLTQYTLAGLCLGLLTWATASSRVASKPRYTSHG
jgi:hypothetical protein